jgi:hypothetical protein
MFAQMFRLNQRRVKRWSDNTITERKRTNNDLLNTTQVTKHWATRTSHIPCNKDRRRGSRRTTERKRTNNDLHNTPQITKHCCPSVTPSPVFVAWYMWGSCCSMFSYLWSVVKIIVRSFSFCCPSATPSPVFVAWYMWGSCCSMFSYL